MDQQQIQKNKNEIEAAKEELLASTIFDRTKNIQDNGDNIFKVFEINLRNWFFLNLPYSDDEKLPVALLLQDIQDNWRNCFLYYEEQPHLSVADFVQNELDQLETVDINTPQLKEYEEFLATHFLRYANTDKLMRRISVSNYDYSSLAVFVKGKINPGELDIEKLDQSQKRLLWYMDYIFVHELAHFNYPIRADLQQLAKERFHFEFYKNPVIYTEFPKEKLKYLKALKSWFLAQISQRKTEYFLEELPYCYQFILDYANSLVPKSTTIQSEKALSPVEQSPPVEEPDYPKYIFRNYKSFELFKTIADQCSSFPQISFLYRQMSEMENPPLIVVRDTRFREWFNTWSKKISLNEHTKTHNNSKSIDRWHYIILSKN